MDDVSFSKKANISAISRFDPQVKDIVKSASQVALYLFDAKKSKWIKRKVEGACFLYKRKTSPKYGIFIINRLDTSNFVEFMNSTMEIQLQEPYILFRNIFKVIYGLWFYEKSECTEMSTVLQHILKELKEKEKEEEDEDPDQYKSLIHDDAPEKDKACTAEVLDSNSLESRVKPNGQPDSVRQFFAKASKEATKPLPIPQPSCSKSLCSSFQSVAHIEKAQKYDHLENTCSSSAFDVCANKNYKNEVICPLTRKVGLLNNDEHERNVNVIENNMRSMKFGPLSVDVKVPPQNFMHPNDLSSPPPTEFPELIPPGMLLTYTDLSTSSKSDSLSDAGKNQKKNLLTKSQMIHAMEYLMKNDSDFIDKLYDAYLKSTRTN